MLPYFFYDAFLCYFELLFGSKSSNPLLELGPTLQFIIHVDKLPHQFLTPAQLPMRDEVLVMYSKVRPKNVQAWNVAFSSTLF